MTPGHIEQTLDAARARRDAEPTPVRYIPNDVFRRQKAALTRAVNSGNPEKIRATVIATVREWNEGNYAWPDSWHSWQIALNDTLHFHDQILLEDIR